MEEKEMHLVKKVSKELGLTYKELGEKIGYSANTLQQSVSANRLSIQLEKAIGLYIKTIELNEELDKFKILEKAIQDIAKIK